MNTPYISIIVPVYNVEDYLDKCIGTLNKQTYANFEVILIDDGSTDKSGSICDKWVELDNRIKTIHKPNGGVSSARNLGIERSQGEWICFVDPDDWVSEKYLENFISCIGDGHFDLIIQSFWIYNEKTQKSKKTSLPNMEIKGGNRIAKFLEETPNDVHNGFIWHRLFKNKIIRKHNLRFKEGLSFAEDGLFFLQYLGQAQNCIITEKMGYHYRVRESSLTSKGKKLPPIIYKTLLKEYTIALTQCTKNENDTQEQFYKNIKKYFEHMVDSWLFFHTIPQEGNDLKKNLLFLTNIIKEENLKITLTTQLCISYLRIIVKTNKLIQNKGIFLFQNLINFKIKVRYKINRFKISINID